MMFSMFAARHNDAVISSLRNHPLPFPVGSAVVTCRFPSAANMKIIMVTPLKRGGGLVGNKQAPFRRK